MKKDIEFNKSLNDKTNNYEYEIGKILVIEESFKKFYGLYLVDGSHKLFLTSKERLRPALKMARLLNAMYKNGFEDARSLYCEDSFRY